MSDEIDIMNVDLSGGKGNNRIAIPDKINVEAKDIIAAAPTRKFRIYYYINNQEPMPGEMEIEMQVNGVPSLERSKIELMKHMPRELQKIPTLVKISHVQEIAKDNLAAI